jgi:general secretion pathway protein B
MPVQQGGARGIASQPTPATPTSASMPPVQISGATYSENRSHRMLIANGKVVHEGQEIEPGLTVEVISPRSAVLNHRGSRYNINY